MATLISEIDCSQHTTREINQAIKRAAADGVPDVRLTNPAARHCLAVAVMSPTRIVFDGPVGWYCGGMCDGAEIVVNGNCGWSVGENLMSGSIAVHGNGGSSAGATVRGGRVFIEGDTGARTGIAMKGGTVVVGGSVGYMSGPAGTTFAVDAVPFPPAADRPAAQPRKGWLRYPSSAYDQRSAMLFLAPMVVVLMTVAVFPVLYSFWISLFDLKLTRPNRVPFVWFDNYAKVFQDPLFWESVLRTVNFTVLSVLAIMVIATLMALLLNQEFRGRRVLSAILLIPWAIPYVANGLMWKWIYDSGYGALNGLLLQLGFIDKYLVMLGDTHKTLPLITNAFVWKEVPLATILLLVTLKSIRPDLYSAAKVDGANVWQRFIHITLPSLVPGFALVVIYETMMAIRHFDLFFVLTEGGPAEASHVVAWQVYVETFRKLAFGTGAALAYIMALATFVLAWSIIRATSRKL